MGVNAIKERQTPHSPTSIDKTNCFFPVDHRDECRVY